MVKKCYENSFDEGLGSSDHKNILDTSHSTLRCVPGACCVHQDKRRMSVLKFIKCLFIWPLGKWREKKSSRASIGNCTDWKPLTEFENTSQEKEGESKETPNTMEPNLYSNKTPHRPKSDASWETAAQLFLKKRYSTTPKGTFLPTRDRFYKPRWTEWGRLYSLTWNFLELL